MIEGNLEVEGQRELAKQQLACTTGAEMYCEFYSGWGRIFGLGGQPLDEPVVSYGPFVMNNRAQIQRCIADYQAGRMGEL